MYDPSKILAWILANVQGMRLSRCKTLAAIVSAALVMKGVGVLALGRAMSGEIAAKHCTKRVWRFLRNEQLETENVFAALFNFLRPRQGRTIVLVDWTDLHPFQQLVFSLPRDGRALPFMAITVLKGTSEEENKRVMIAAEREAMEMLARICPPDVHPILIADRGFGHPRWLQEIKKRGWHFVQRLSHIHQVSVETHMGTLKELGIRRGWRQPADLAAALSEYLAERRSRLVGHSGASVVPFPGALDGVPVFNLPDKANKAFDRDCAAAKIPKRDGAGRVMNFHCLRHTFGTLLARSGVSLQVAQRAMRHSTPALTSNVYMHLGLIDVAGAVDKLPAIGAVAHEAAEMVANSVTPTVTPDSDNPWENGAFSGNSEPLSRITRTEGTIRISSNAGKGFQEVARKKLGGPCRTRTCDQVIMSHLL